MPIKNDESFQGRQKANADGYARLAWSLLLPTAKSKAKSLTDALFALEEPWQSRFLNLVANLATSATWDGRQPTREEVLAWLSADLDLYREVKLLLEAWWRPKK